MLRVATTFLSPAEMGKVSLVLTTTAFFALFLVNPVGMFINRRLHAWQASGAARHYLIRYVNYLIFVAVVAAISVPLLYLAGLVNFGISVSWLILLISGSLLFNTINQTTIPSLNLLGDSARFVFLTVATVAASFAFATLFVKLVQPSAHYWLLGLLLGQAFLGVIGAKVLFSRLKKQASFHAPPVIVKQHLQTLFKFAWPVAIAAGLGWVQGQGYRYLIERQLDLAQLGIFVAGYAISAGMIAGFESILTTYFQPRLYRDVNTAQQAEKSAIWQRYAAAVIPSMLLTVVLIMILASELTQMFLGENFQSASDYVILGALAEAARVLVGVYSLIAHVHMQTRWLIIPNFLGAIISITLCVFLIPGLGAMGAGIGLAVSGLAVVLTMHVYLARHVGGGMPIQPIVIACIAATTLWGVALVVRNLLGTSGWVPFVASLALISTAFLGLQYLFLRQHIADKR